MEGRGAKGFWKPSASPRDFPACGLGFRGCGV